MQLKERAPFPWQKTLWATLCEQFESQQLAHAYLIAGSRGTGKFLVATEFARFILCSAPNKGLACGECRNCSLGGESGHPDLVQIEIEEGSKVIKIEQVRDLLGFLSQTSHGGRAKIAVISDAHRMNTAAANALLKTLEEPTQNTFLFLLSDMPGSLMATIRSRCQKLLMPKPDTQEAIAWLKHHLPDQDDPHLLIQAAGDCPLRALDLAQSGALENQQQFLQKFLQLSAGETTIQATVALAGKLGEASAIGYLREVSTILIKYLLINQQAGDMQPEQQSLLALVRAKCTDSRRLLTELMAFYGQVHEAQRQLSSGTNPNAQLIMESLLWHWSRLMHTRRTA